MKKTLVALAVLASTGTAFAQAAAPASSVTLYGLLDAGVIALEKPTATAGTVGSAGTTGGSLTGAADSALASSVWGLRGTENIGGGLSAVFNVEGDIDTRSGTFNAAGLFRRGAFVGLAGGFGEVTFGLRLNPFIGAFRTGEVMASNSLGVSSLVGIGSADFFTKNSVHYTSPNLGGVTLRAQYGFGNKPGSSDDGSMLAVSAIYSAGPLVAGLAYQDRQALGTAAVSANDANPAQTSSVGFVKYTMGPATLGASFFKNEIAGTKTLGAYTTSGTIEGYMLGASYAVSKQLRVGVNAVSAEGSDLMNVQATYALSPRSSLYFQHTTTDNARAVAFQPAWGFGVGGARGARQAATGIGVVHRF